jgi:hypothetical protein
MENNNKKSIFNSRMFIGIALIISTVIATYTFYRIRSFDNTLTVTGSATKQVTSDHVKWVGVINHIVKVSNLKGGYASMASDLNNVQAFLKDHNINPDQVVVSPVFMDQNYDQPQGAEKSYTLRQTIDVNSSDVLGITEIATNLTQPPITSTTSNTLNWKQSVAQKNSKPSGQLFYLH